MGDQKHSQGVEEVVMAGVKLEENASNDVRSTAYLGAHIKLHPVVAEREQGLVTRTVQEWQRMHGSQKKLQ